MADPSWPDCVTDKAWVKAVGFNASTTNNCSAEEPLNGKWKCGVSSDIKLQEVPGNVPAEIQDFLFFPPADENASGKRTMRFNVSQDIKNVCLAFTFASYSPIAADGNVTISEVALKKVESANYKFDYPVSSFNTMDRKNVKAVRLVFSVAKNGEEGIDSLVVPIPSNGPRD